MEMEKYVKRMEAENPEWYGKVIRQSVYNGWQAREQWLHGSARSAVMPEVQREFWENVVQRQIEGYYGIDNFNPAENYCATRTEHNFPEALPDVKEASFVTEAIRKVFHVRFLRKAKTMRWVGADGVAHWPYEPRWDGLQD